MGAAPVTPENKPQTAAHNPQGAAKAEGERREGLSAYEREALAVDRAANRIGEAANRISEEQRNYAYWQLYAAGAGVFFTALAAIAAIAAAIYAKRAAEAAADSAKADNDALDETRKAAVAAREDAAEQTKRWLEQMNLSADTARASQAGAEAARRQADIAAGTATAQLRPYLYMTGERFTDRWLAEGPTGKHVIDVVFALKNFGQTPAKHVRMKAATLLGGYWSEDFTPDFEKSVWVHWADIPPGDERPWNDETGYRLAKFSPQDRAAVEQARASVFFHGIVEYEDGDGLKYETNFRRALTGQHFCQRSIVPEHGNKAT